MLWMKCARTTHFPFCIHNMLGEVGASSVRFLRFDISSRNTDGRNTIRYTYHIRIPGKISITCRHLSVVAARTVQHGNAPRVAATERHTSGQVRTGGVIFSLSWSEAESCRTRYTSWEHWNAELVRGALTRVTLQLLIHGNCLMVAVAVQHDVAKTPDGPLRPRCCGSGTQNSTG